MSSLRQQDRASLCRFTFSDGRQCRTPRSSGHPHFCSDHARKDSQARAADKLARDLSYFFSGEYLSACDLTTALGRLIAGVARGDIKPRSARTLAYLAQTLVQAIHLAQNEYINTFGSDGWRKSIRNSVKGNTDYLYPPAPKPAAVTQPASVAHPAQTPVNCHSERSEESAFSSNSSLATHVSPLPQAPQSEIPALSEPAPTLHTPLPPTRSEFVQQVVAGLPRSSRSDPVRQTGGGQTLHPVEILQGCHSDAVAQVFRPEEPAVSPSPASPSQPASTSPQPVETAANCHSDAVAQAGIYPDRVGRPEEAAFSSNSSLATHHSFTPALSGPLP